MEIFSIKIDGCYKVIFRKSLSVEKKIEFSNHLNEFLKPSAHTKIIKGVLTIYETPTQEKINILSDKLFSLHSNIVKWDGHYKI